MRAISQAKQLKKFAACSGVTEDSLGLPRMSVVLGVAPRDLFRQLSDSCQLYKLNNYDQKACTY